MRRLPAIVLLIATAFAASTAGRAPQREIDNVAAFARLYGVVRYFYPSDAAAALDWNRFAVHAVSRVRAASDPQSLEATLQSLVNPLGPEIIIARKLPPTPAAGTPDSALIAWRYAGAAVSALVSQNVYRAKRTHRPLVMSPIADGFASVMQSLPALPLRGKTIRLRGLVRAEPSSDAAAGAALWLRVDREAAQRGFFDNMGNRPIRAQEWRHYEIEGTVADDATNLSFGAMAPSTVTAEFESMELSVRDGPGAWTPIAIQDPGFEDAAGSSGWTRAGTSKSAVITRPAGTAPEGRQFLRLSPPTPGVLTAEIFAAPPPVTGAHADVDLGSGLHARVPLALSEQQASGEGTQGDRLEALRVAIASVVPPSGELDVDTRLADVVVAWNVFRHFYPYWNEARVDWDQRLTPQLELAYDATTRGAHRDALRLLVADLGDGHGNVVDPQASGPQAVLPIQLQVIEGQVTITASPSKIAPVGAVVSSIDGVAAGRRLADAVRLTSGTPQWREWRALQEIITCSAGATVTLVVDSGDGPRPASVPCGPQRVVEQRPAAVGELVPGVWYVDLTRAPMSEITPVLNQLAGATGIVFDLRGYPTDAGNQILPHLLVSPESDRWMHIDRIVGPFGKSAGTQSMGWNLRPASPHLGGRRVFLTDGRAISYAESVMGYVADRKLGTIVGATTAGANGNVAVFVVPGGYRVAFTGMRVTGHDGTAVHHLVGVKPDLPMTPTLAGLRQGRDEVLERALTLIRGQ